MAIIASDIKKRLSGGASNTDPAASLGGIMSTTTEAGASIFDDVTSGEASAGDIEYRCIYALNTHGSLTLTSAKVFISAQTPSGDTAVAIALGGEGLNGTAEAIANENTAPSGESFSAPATYAAGLSLGDLAPGDRYPIWIRRTINAAAAGASDGFTISIQGDTAP